MRAKFLSMLAGLAFLVSVSSAWALTCPTGQHQVCHGGSGRGGGYHTTCSCVNNPPPTCVTAWGTQIPAGATVMLYDAYQVYAPDTCTNHASQVMCVLNSDNTVTLVPAGATGYTVCSVLYPDTEDGGN